MKYDKLYIGSWVIKWPDKVKDLLGNTVNCKLIDDR